MFKAVPAHGEDSVHACCEYDPMSRNGTNKVKQMEMDGLGGGREASRQICQEQKVSVTGFQMTVQKLNLGSLLKF